MTKGFTNASHSLIDGPPAMVAQDMSLWEYAEREAKAAAVIAQRIAEATEQRDAAQALTEETVEWKEAEAVKARLADARKAALEADPDVAAEREASKVARLALRKVASFRTAKALGKDIRVLKSVQSETERRAVDALATGRKPGLVEKC